jgi:aryl-alcohol dehydrogenase-like predicted oxidoreductase
VENRTLGENGPLVSVVGLGCNNFAGRIGLEESRLVIDSAIDAGITLFDTADVYGNRGGSEDIIGQVLGNRRDKVLIATKFAGKMDDSGDLQGGSRNYVAKAVDASLQRLRTDRIDLYQMHHPDDNVPIEETLRGLDDVVRQGKVRYIGCSNFRSWQVVEATWTSRLLDLPAFVSCQDEYSLVRRDLDKDGLPMMQKYGLGLLPYFPLACGMLTGKYHRGGDLPEDARITKSQGLQERYFTDENWFVVERLEEFTAKRSHTLLDLAFSWLAARPTVASVIAGATKPEQVQMNVAAAGWKLDEEELAVIDKITRPA